MKKSILHFILGLMIIWILSFGLTFVVAFVSELARVHLVDVMVMAPVLTIGMSIMSSRIRGLVIYLGWCVSPEHLPEQRR